MNGARAAQAYASLAYKQPLSAHGVCFFYCEEDTRQIGGLRLYTAARWELATPVTSDLRRFVAGLTDTAQRFAAAGRSARRRWDPRGPEKPLVNKLPDGIMKARLTYIGLGVETLDTDRGNWMDLTALTRNEDPLRRAITIDLPGEAIVVLTDGSLVRAVRDSSVPFGQSTVWSTHALEASRHFNHTSNLLEKLGAPLAEAWPEIEHLSETLRQHYQAGQS